MTGNKIKHFSEIHILIFTTGKPEMWLFLTAWGTHIPIKVPSPVKICKSLLSVTPAHVLLDFNMADLNFTKLKVVFGFTKELMD